MGFDSARKFPNRSLLPVFFAVSSVCSAQTYLWPTDASRWMTSSFAESRPGRMHAAIDIKTWNRTGYKVFAIRNGFIQRIRVSPFGYGKAIYLKLDTGEIVVYAHLDRFNQALEDYVAQEQEKSGRYRIDHYLPAGRFPVKQGELLGYTGDTGIGVPHLHFEMRDERNRPFNPLLRGYKIEDSVAPVVTGLAVIPLRPGSRIDDDFRPVRLRLRRLARNRYEIAEPFSFDGEVGLAINSFDQSNEGSNRFHVYRIDLYIDGKPHFRVTYDRFSYGHNHDVQLERNYRLARQGFGYYVHLFQHPDNRLSFYQTFNQARGRLIAAESHSPGTTAGSNGHPLEVLAPGLHEFTIDLRDFFGNSTTLSGQFIAGKRFQFTPEIVLADSLYLADLHADGVAIASLQVDWQQLPGGDGWQPVVGQQHISAMPASSSFAIALPLLAAAERPLVWRFIATTVAAVASWPSYFFAGEHATTAVEAPMEITLFPEFYDDYLRLGIKSNHPLRSEPLIEVTNGDGSTFNPSAIQKKLLEYVLLIPLRQVQGRGIRIVVQGEGIGGQLAAAEYRFDNFRIPRRQSGALHSLDGNVRVSFGSQSLYDDLFGRIIRDESVRGLMDGKALSAVYRVEPQDVPLKFGALVHIKYPDSLQGIRVKQLGIYYRVGGDRWVFIDNQVDTLRREVSAKVLSLEDFVLGVDDIAPEVHVRNLRDGQNVAPRHQFVVYVIDRESGFASEESLVMRIDGKKVIAEYDPEERTVTFTPRRPLNRGKHTLQFTATDRCQNSSSVELTFFARQE